MSDSGLDLSSQEDRYSRLRMISWWDQSLLARSKVLVIGAGALGNEIIKNLALLGVGTVVIVDFDMVEASNLSRSVLFRPEDEGRSKAEAACEAARAINTDCSFIPLQADANWDVGLGVYRWADVVICGLDNREARLAVNRACWKTGRTWVDGATESFRGVARVFQPPDGVCYECTLSEQDQRIMAVRDSCGFFAREAYRQGRTPTTPTTSSVIAGVQVQEAIKLLHDKHELPSLIGRGFFFDGSSYECFTIEYSRRDDCLSHETYSNVVETDLDRRSATLADVLDKAESVLGGDATIDLPSEMVTELTCTHCGKTQAFHRLLAAVTADDARCPDCGAERVPDVVCECARGSAFENIPLAEMGFGVWDIIPARVAEREVHIEISLDRQRVLGGF